mmetsp:Transcript_37194/g.81752  ORF Transcript_37194/g.81752 Transcript_37194/m.81752 type:complete len:203 (-) Transcript_37194:730-1338(-)
MGDALQSNSTASANCSAYEPRAMLTWSRLIDMSAEMLSITPARSSSLLIVMVAMLRPAPPSVWLGNSAPPNGSRSSSWNFSSCSNLPSSMISISTLWCITPSAKVSVPEAAVKSAGATAEPSLVSKRHPTVPRQLPLRSTSTTTFLSLSLTTSWSESSWSTAAPSSSWTVTVQKEGSPMTPPEDGDVRWIWKTASPSAASSS